MRRHLSYANVVATLALVFAMSGGALAASHYVINSTKEINPKVLKRLKGAGGAKGAKGPAGATGVQGGAGPKGETGKEGSPGKNGATNVVERFAEGTAANTAVGEATANCAAGERATGGGPELFNGNDGGQDYLDSMPTPTGAGETPTGWRLVWFNNSGLSDTMRVYVVCAAP
jgi:hypothetical protein